MGNQKGMATAPRTPETRAQGARIRAERTRAGLSRRDFAKLIPTGAKQISRMEQGYRVSNVRLAKVAKVLGLSYDYIKTGQGPKIPEALAPTAQGGLFETAVIQLVRRVLAEELEKALARWFQVPAPAAPRTKPAGRDAGGRPRRARAS